MFRSKFVVVVLGIVGFAALAGAGYALGSRQNEPEKTPEQRQTAAWAAEIRTATARGGQDRVVATVDGVPILMAQVSGILAASKAFEGTNPDAPSTPEAALDQLIENRLIAAAAERAGIQVTDSDVTATIQAGTVDPLKNGTLTAEQREAAEATLALSGTDVDSVLKHEPTRRVVRDRLLRESYLELTGFEPATIAAEAREEIAVEVVPGALQP